jgi:hypothetical protein
VTGFRIDETPAGIAPWQILQSTGLCNFRSDPDDPFVSFFNVPRRSGLLVPSTWSAPSIPLPPQGARVMGFQLSVYALTEPNKPACMIDSFLVGVANGVVNSAINYVWQQFLVTDNEPIVRRYVYRGAGFAGIRADGLEDSGAPYFSLTMTHNHQNGSCWIDCIELQLLYTFGAEEPMLQTLPSAVTTTAKDTVANITEMINETVSTSLMGLDDQENTAALLGGVIGLAVALGVVLLVLIVIIAIAMRLWRRLNTQSNPGSLSAPAQAQPQAQHASPATTAIYQSHGLNSTRYEMLELGAPPNKTNYIPGTALTNDA